MENEWSDAERAAVEAIHPWSRQACRNCRYKYENYAFLKRNPTNTDSIDDVLSEGPAFRRQMGKSIFRPSFYSGGVFDSRRHGEDAIFIETALQALRSQLTAEKTRYSLKHGNLEDYTQRFVYEKSLHRVFQLASRVCFPKNTRAPVGLNPERFVAECNSCKCWMPTVEFKTRYCETCQEQKPAARY